MSLFKLLRCGGKPADRIVLSRTAIAALSMPDQTCAGCGKIVAGQELYHNNYCCPECGWLFRMSARQRINMIFDSESFEEYDPNLTGENVLEFEGYSEKLEKSRTNSGEQEAVLCGKVLLGGIPVCTFVMEPSFMMGSMGTAVGEKITRLFETALEKRLPVIGFSASGGARMQEGLFSLMQMACTSAAVKRHSDAGLLYISVLTDPTMGGVTASFAMLGDVIASESGASIGFAGARVVRQTTGKELPEGFQSTESLMKHGFIDQIIPRSEQRKTLQMLLQMHGGNYGTDTAL